MSLSGFDQSLASCLCVRRAAQGRGTGPRVFLCHFHLRRPPAPDFSLALCLRPAAALHAGHQRHVAVEAFPSAHCWPCQMARPKPNDRKTTDRRVSTRMSLGVKVRYHILLSGRCVTSRAPLRGDLLSGNKPQIFPRRHVYPSVYNLQLCFMFAAVRPFTGLAKEQKQSVRHMFSNTLTGWRSFD